MEITLNLPDNIYQNFTRLAEKKHRRVEEVITDKLQADFSTESLDFEEKVAGLKDEAVLALAQLKIPKVQADRMTMLLDRLNEGLITDSEEGELDIYTELCQISSLRKAYGIAEASKRGLLASLSDLK